LREDAMKKKLGRELKFEESEALFMHTTGAGNSNDEFRYHDMVRELNEWK
jgi:hypothetical protein